MLLDVRSTPVELELRPAEAAVRVGSATHVLVRTTAHRSATVEPVEVTLNRTVVGRGRATRVTRTDVVDRAIAVVGALPAGRSFAEWVSLTVPAADPATVDTDLVEVRWTIHASARTRHARSAHAEEKLIVREAPPDAGWPERSEPVIADEGWAEVGFEALSTRRLTPGVPVRGTVVVRPLRPTRAVGVRLELVLREQIDSPPPTGSAVPLPERIVVAALRLDGAVDLDPGRRARLPFRLPVPDRLPAPTVETPGFSARWYLRAVLLIPDRAGPSGAVELHGGSAECR